jgi:hypothetical protein
MIKHVKAFLTSVDNRPHKNKHGTKFQALFLEDYAVYAALRGADFKKVSHMEDGANAREAIESAISKIDSYSEKSAERIKTRQLQITSVVIRVMPEGSVLEDLAELKEILVQALAK